MRYLLLFLAVSCFGQITQYPATSGGGGNTTSSTLTSGNLPVATGANAIGATTIAVVNNQITTPSIIGLSATVINSADYVGAHTTAAYGTCDGSTDVTAYLQSALDAAFGSSASPHGRSNATLNRIFVLPAGKCIITAPLAVRSVSGGHIQGNQRGNTVIENTATNGNVFNTNGFEYSHVQGITFTVHGTGVAFNMDWDNTGSGALQGNTFQDDNFFGDGPASGSIGVDIGKTGFQGSEDVFLDCHFGGLGKGLATENFNALQNTVVGGNFQNNNVGVYMQAGTVNVYSAGFQLSQIEDIFKGSNANDGFVLSAIRTESTNFALIQNQTNVHIDGVSHDAASLTNGFFCDCQQGSGEISNARSLYGNVIVAGTNLTIHDSQFGRSDWITGAIAGIANQVDINDVLINTNASASLIPHQTLTNAGITQTLMGSSGWQLATTAGVEEFGVAPSGAIQTGFSWGFIGGTAFIRDFIGHGILFKSEDNSTYNLAVTYNTNYSGANAVGVYRGESYCWTNSSFAYGPCDTGLSSPSAGVISVDTTTIGNGAGGLSLTGITNKLGGKFICTHGTNGTCGVATLSAGTVVISTTAIAALAVAGAAGDIVHLECANNPATTTITACTTQPYVSAIIPGTSFTIGGTLTDTVYWEIRHIN